MRKNKIGVDKASEQIACRGLAVHLALAYAEEVGNEPNTCLISCSRQDDRLVASIGLSDPWGCNRDAINFSRDFVERYLRLRGRVLLKTSCIDVCSETAINHLHKLARYFVTAYLYKLKELALIEKHEYFAIVTWDGRYLIGEGEEDRISIPLIKGPVFAHTHPSSTCTPSYKDLLSLQDFLSEGGLVEAIVAKDCIFIAESLGLSEDDYWELQSISDCLRKANEYNMVLNCLSRLYNLKTLNTYIIAF